jgi:alkanesulfonate monooxygenase
MRAYGAITAMRVSLSAFRHPRRHPARRCRSERPGPPTVSVSGAAEEVAATEADVQLFWGEPLDGIAARVARLKELSDTLGREHAPLEFGLRITTLVRDTTEEAWRDAEAKVAQMPTTRPRRRRRGSQRIQPRPRPPTTPSTTSC